MEIAVKRLWPVPNVCCIGTVEIDGASFCFSLEDPVREVSGLAVTEWKIDGETAIPRGRYRVVMDWSERFAKMMPHILDVPGFTGIRFHGGNRAKDVLGCIAVGEKRYDETTIGDSANILALLIEMIETTIASGFEVWVTVS